MSNISYDFESDEYYEQLEQQEWRDYVEVCVEYGCLNCGAEVDWDELVGYHNCINCSEV